MQMYPFDKKPAFFPFVSAEIFFEGSEERDNEGLDNDALDSELDRILGLCNQEPDDAASVVPQARLKRANRKQPDTIAGNV